MPGKYTCLYSSLLLNSPFIPSLIAVLYLNNMQKMLQIENGGLQASYFMTRIGILASRSGQKVVKESKLCH